MNFCIFTTDFDFVSKIKALVVSENVAVFVHRNDRFFQTWSHIRMYMDKKL